MQISLGHKFSKHFVNTDYMQAALYRALRQNHESAQSLLLWNSLSSQDDESTNSFM
jgi:hypothetical protein